MVSHLHFKALIRHENLFSGKMWVQTFIARILTSYILVSSPWSGTYVANIFIPSPSLCLTFLSSLQCVSKTFFFFFSMPWASCVLSKNSFPNPRSKGFAPRFYSSNFMVVCFTFGSTMHCEWFLHMVLGTSRGCSIFIRPSQSSQCFSTIFEKNTFPQPLI